MARTHLPVRVSPNWIPLAALGIDKGASDTDIKRRYRKLMSENHPDKLIAEGVPDELLRVATERAQEITAAYEVIQNARGLK